MAYTNEFLLELTKIINNERERKLAACQQIMRERGTEKIQKDSEWIEAEVWSEDFIDEDSGEVISIERKMIVPQTVERILENDKLLARLLNSKTLYKLIEPEF